MRIKEITIRITGKRGTDLDFALDEAVQRIKDGNIAGFDSNDSSSFSFEIKESTEPMELSYISSEAKKLAEYFEPNTTESPVAPLRRIATNQSESGFGMDSFSGFIDGNTASMMQILIDECGGVEQDGHIDVAKKLGGYFDFLPDTETLFGE